MKTFRSELHAIAAEVDRREQALERLAFCFDVYLTHTRDGAKPTEDMDAAKATSQLEEAICNALGLPSQALAPIVEGKLSSLRLLHEHDWKSTDHALIDRCSICGEERA